MSVRKLQIPDLSEFNPSTKDAAALIARVGRPNSWIAGKIGVSERRLRYIVAGYRMAGKVRIDTHIKYPEQFALECLVAAIEATALD